MSIKNAIKRILGREELHEVSRILKGNQEDLSSLVKKVEDLSFQVGKMDVLKDDVSLLSGGLSSLKTELLEVKNNFQYANLELLLLPKTDKRKILLVGFYGAPNLGDELMLETLLQHFGTREDIDITVMLCDNPSYDIRKYKNINIIHYPKTMFDINHIAGYFDTVIFGGGAIIDDNLYDKANPFYADLGTVLIDLSVKTILRGKDLYCIALSSNTELKNKDFIEGLSFIVQNAKHFSVRDENSIEVLKKLVKDYKKILLVNDIIFANKDIEVLEKKESKVFQVGLNFICNDDTFEILEKISKWVEDYLGEKNIKDYSINLIPFYSYTNNDIKFYSELKKSFKSADPVNIIEQPNGMVELCEVLSSQDIVISMRYHCTIVSAILNTPTLAISYDKHPHYPNKMLFLKKLLNVELLDYSSITYEKIHRNLDVILDKKPQVFTELLDNSQNDISSLVNSIK